ncbi:MAG TPA: HD domain-containing protein [Candidatus Nitrosotenuis sp.]|nr:HD domain-containing protein [Candidatus Nitrosotenuis sp.]
MGQDYLKETQGNTNLAEFFKTVLKLKTVPRQGWIDKLGLKDPESVADHCFSTSVMAMILSDKKNLDTTKIIKMSLLHDLAEAITGDLTPDNMPKTKKIEMENLAMTQILSKLGDPQKSEYLDIWAEYQKNNSKEAKLLHQIDKLEMAMQADAYHKKGHTQTLPFFDTAKKEITDDDLLEILTKFYKS